ncbi:MAG TPA: AAA family ATPase [Telluria sp.]
MRILRIAGSNLASLGEPFEVNFESEPLASAGVFAIGGPTGAGKSTLLDALCLALYDATPRLARAGRSAGTLPDVGEEVVSPYDPRTLLRRGAAEGHAEVDFVGSDNARYRARWSVRRARTKATGALQKSVLSLLRLADGVALGGTKTEVAQEIVARIGLSFEQFTRAVLLAQNEFSAFLKTDESERGELLETLTGTEVYTALSRRAFERYKEEQARLQQLSSRLADGMPMPAEQREQMEQAAHVAAAALETVRVVRDEAEAKWRWQQDDTRLAASVSQAEQALAAASAGHLDALPRRRALATVDAAQPARPLAADVSRLRAEGASIEKLIAESTVALERSQLVARDAHTLVEAAQGELQAAEQVQCDSLPQLDAAKALDARIGALAPGHDAARKASEEAAIVAALSQVALDTLVAERAALVKAQEQASQWLAGQREVEPLATQWTRWQKMLADAARAAANIAQLATARDAALAHANVAHDATQRAQAALSHAVQRTLELEEARRQAAEALSLFDFDAMRKQRQEIDRQRAGLAAAEKRWRQLDAAAAALREAQEQRQKAQASMESAVAARAEAAATAAQLEAALAQAEASHSAAQSACADSVERLRATLEDDKPCPVCGSESHPWHHQDEMLKAMFRSLAAQVTQARNAAGANAARAAALTSTIAHCGEQLAALERDIAGLGEAHATAAQAWAADPHSAHDNVDALWFDQQAEAANATAATLEQREDAGRAALVARDRAQQACDAAAGARQTAQEAAAAAQAASTQAAAARDAAAERHQSAVAALDALLDDLDAAFEQSAWRDQWHADPDAFMRQCASAVEAWTLRSQALAQARDKLAELEAGHAAAIERQSSSSAALETARKSFAQADAQLAALRSERQALLGGRAAAEVEQALSSRVAQCRDALAARQLGSQQASHAEVRAREALEHARARGRTNGEALVLATGKLDAWIASFDATGCELDDITGPDALAALLAMDPEWIEGERIALGQLDAAVSSATTVLAERRDQHARHRAATQATDTAPELLADETARARAQWEEANNALISLRLQLSQDDARRESAQTIMGQVEKQQEVERRWGRMNELIGSSDGKKFRNYAQQFTLDVLLGYANSHLSHLARRYRLERVPTAGGPSLGLLVRDQDMGGEVRSVNSLSGGESFLVSLALALGLASLSSNRVRVESLFIDEGFGSLDSDTLRVAMDALDSLQAMGRKVGVISHVQEMAERISARIIVQPGGAGLSTVTVP